MFWLSTILIVLHYFLLAQWFLSFVEFMDPFETLSRAIHELSARTKRGRANLIIPQVTVQHLLKRWVTDPSSESPESILKCRPQAPPRPTESEPREVTPGPGIFSLFLVTPPQSEGQGSPPATAISLPVLALAGSEAHTPLAPTCLSPEEPSSLRSFPHNQRAPLPASSPTLRTGPGTYGHPGSTHSRLLDSTAHSQGACPAPPPSRLSSLIHEDPPLPRVPALPLAHHSWLVSSSLNAQPSPIGNHLPLHSGQHILVRGSP